MCECQESHPARPTRNVAWDLQEWALQGTRLWHMLNLGAKLWELFEK